MNKINFFIYFFYNLYIFYNLVYKLIRNLSLTLFNTVKLVSLSPFPTKVPYVILKKKNCVKVFWIYCTLLSTIFHGTKWSGFIDFNLIVKPLMSIRWRARTCIHPWRSWTASDFILMKSLFMTLNKNLDHVVKEFIPRALCRFLLQTYSGALMMPRSIFFFSNVEWCCYCFVWYNPRSEYH